MKDFFVAAITKRENIIYGCFGLPDFQKNKNET